jgi:hypothetical protein
LEAEREGVERRRMMGREEKRIVIVVMEVGLCMDVFGLVLKGTFL